MIDAKIGFIGFGSMAGAICEGLLTKEAVSPRNVYACARNIEKLQKRCESYGINACGTADEVIAVSDIVVIAVLPHQVESFVKENADALRGVPIFCIASKINYADFVSYLGEGYNHISGIPNISIASGAGIIVTEATHSLTEEQLQLFESVFGCTARIEYFSTGMMAVADTGAGCAPAFADMFIEALSDGLVKHGMPRAQAYSIVPQMMIGAASYMIKSGKHPGDLKDAVCTPGGYTIAGVSALEEKGFRHSLIYAVDKIIEKGEK